MKTLIIILSWFFIGQLQWYAIKNKYLKIDCKNALIANNELQCVHASNSSMSDEIGYND